jgi:acyl-CoA thioesterase I
MAKSTENPCALPRTRELIAAGKPVRVVCYGDSISEVGRSPGYHGGATTPEKNWGQQLGGLLRQQWPKVAFTVLNFGIGGQNSYEGLGRLDWLAELKPDLVLIAFGANDCGYHYLIPTETGLAIKSMVEGVRGRYGADVMVLCSGGESPLQPSWQHADETIAATRQAATETKAPFVDIRAAVLQATDHGKRWSEFHNGIQDCHPNDRGHELWATTVFGVIRACLK